MKVRFGFMLLISSLVLSGCSLPSFGKKATPSEPDPSTTPTTPEPAVQNLKSASPTTFDSPVVSTLTTAQTKAKLWQDDAVLHYVSVELPVDLRLNAATNTYVFGSGKAASDWWTYSLSEATSKSIRAIIPKDDYLGSSIVPINLNYWKMNYIEAFQLADANGGVDFRTKQPETRVTLYLSHRAPNQWLWWTVQYKAAAGTLLTLLVNPNQGEVIDSAGKQLVPPATGTSAAGTPTSRTDDPSPTTASSSAATSTTSALPVSSVDSATP